MKQELFGTAMCMGEPIRYYLLTASECYGIGVEYCGEWAMLPGLTRNRLCAEGLLGIMMRGAVTPVTARDVAEDCLEGIKI